MPFLPSNAHFRCNMQKGILLINLGTPDDANKACVKRYLKQFLLDPRVIDLPFLLRQILVRGIIIPFRTKNSLHAYQSIWTKEGSPLKVFSQALCDKLAKRYTPQVQVELAMRYANPSIQAKLERLKHCDEICIIPLFPQYSSAATGSAMQEVMRCIQSWQVIPKLSIIRDFHDHHPFIQAVAATIRDKTFDYILFSYHGLPERQCQKAGCNTVCKTPCPLPKDKNPHCYKAQCFQTTRLIAKELNLDPNAYQTSFQSRLGKTPWIKPYTDEVLSDLASKGIKDLAIVCPSFVVDCLETLEEIGMQAKQQWLSLGGEGFELIPCLNQDDGLVDALSELVPFHTQKV